MQVADQFEVLRMLDGAELEAVVKKHKPDLIVPEIEAIRTEKLLEFERDGMTVIPSATAAHLTMNRNAIRDVAAKELKLRTAKYEYAESEEELVAASVKVGFPNVVKPVMSSSGKGQSVVMNPTEVRSAWKYAATHRRGDQSKVIVEEFIPFDLEITLLTVRQANGKTLFVPPIGHRQERGDYQESWMPAAVTPRQLKAGQSMAKKVTARLGGVGLFGVEFFVGRNGVVYFSELSPRPHDTGMVTLISQDLSEFDLHARAILGLPIPAVRSRGPAASAVILADSEFKNPNYFGIDNALKGKDVELRIFGKPEALPYRRMGVALALGKNPKDARKKAQSAARSVSVVPSGSRS